MHNLHPDVPTDSLRSVPPSDPSCCGANRPYHNLTKWDEDWPAKHNIYYDVDGRNKATHHPSNPTGKVVAMKAGECHVLIDDSPKQIEGLMKINTFRDTYHETIPILPMENWNDPNRQNRLSGAYVDRGFQKRDGYRALLLFLEIIVYVVCVNLSRGYTAHHPDKFEDRPRCNRKAFGLDHDMQVNYAKIGLPDPKSATGDSIVPSGHGMENRERQQSAIIFVLLVITSNSLKWSLNNSRTGNARILRLPPVLQALPSLLVLL